MPMRPFSFFPSLPRFPFIPALLAAAGACATAAPSPGDDTKLPDTGQTVRYTRVFGEDADYAGRSPAYADNGDGTVTDRVTGLVWQKTDGGEMTWEKAGEYARNLRLGGHADWRLPNGMELLGIMNHGMHGPAMDTAVFTKTTARYWWTDTPRADDASKVWVVNSGGGIGAHAKAQTVSAGGDRPMHVRCVRGASVFGRAPLLSDNGDGTVTDRRTGLIWQKNTSARVMSWEAALAYCAALDLAGARDWRLPNIKELRSISDDTRVGPSVDTRFFPAVTAVRHWSSTTQVGRPAQAWHVDFTTGLVTYADKKEALAVIAVRGGAAVPGAREKPEPDPRVFVGLGKGGKNEKPH